MTHKTPHVLTDKLAANYTKQVLFNPLATVYENMDRAVYDTPSVYASPFLLEALQQAEKFIDRLLLQGAWSQQEAEEISMIAREAITKAGA